MLGHWRQNVKNPGENQNLDERGHGLIVSDEEMEAAAAAFDEFDSGCGQDHDPDQWKDQAQWRAALTAALEVRMRRLAEEAERGFSPEQIGEPRLGGYVRGLVERARRAEEAFADGQAFEQQHAEHDHNPDTCLECENLDEAAFQRGLEWERDEGGVGLVGSRRHGPRHVGWDRVIEALSASVDEAIHDTMDALRIMEGPHDPESTGAG